MRAISILLTTLLAASPATAQEPRPAGVQPFAVGRWAVVIGAERYLDETNVPRAQGAVNDALAIRDWLVNTAGWPAENVELLNENDPGRIGVAENAPTRKNILRSLESLRKKVRPGDFVLIYFAGHAASLASEQGRALGLLEEPDFLLPIDTLLQDVRDSGVHLGREVERLASQGVYKIVCLLDTSPRGRSPRELLKETQSGDRMLRGLARGNGVTAWMAGLGETPLVIRQQSDVSIGQSLMTQSLLKYLGRDSDRPNNLAFVLTGMRADRELQKQGFRTLGKFGPGFSLWPDRFKLPSPFDEPFIQRGHSDAVHDIEISVDGGRIFSASQDTTVRVWDIEDGSLLGVINHPGSYNGIHRIAMGPSGQLGFLDGKGVVFFYDEQRREFAAQSAFDSAVFDGRRAEDLCFLPFDDKQAQPELRAMSVNEGRLQTWVLDAAAGQRIASAEMRDVARLAVAPRSGPWSYAIVRSTSPDTLELFDGQKGTPIAKAGFANARIVGIAFSDDPNGIYAALTDQDGSTRIVRFDPGKNRSIWSIPLGIDPLEAVEISRKSGRLFVGLIGKANRKDRKLVRPRDRILIVPDTDQPTEAQKFATIVLDAGTFLDGSTDLETSPNANRLAAVVNPGRKVLVWDISETDNEPKAEIRPLGSEGGHKGVTSTKFAPDDRNLILGYATGEIRIVRLEDTAEDIVAPPSLGRPRFVKVSPDRTRMLQINDDGKAVVWKLKNPYGLHRLLGLYHPIAAYLPNGDLVLVERRRENEEKKLVEPLRDDESSLVIVDGQRFHVKKRLANPPRNQIRGEPTEHVLNSISRISVSKDGKLLAVAANNSSIYLWKLDQDTYWGSLALEGDVKSLEFSPESHRVLIGESLEVEDNRTQTLRVVDILGHDRPAPPQLDTKRTWQISENRARFDIVQARFSPVDPNVVLVARSDGRFGIVRIDDADAAGAWPSNWRLSGRDVESYDCLVSADGDWYVGVGDHKNFWIVPRDESARQKFLENRRRNPRRLDHEERIVCLDSWQVEGDDSACMLASASEDGSVKLWKLSAVDCQLRLLSTLFADRNASEWIAFAPNARFDATQTMATRVSWRPKQEATESLSGESAEAYRRLTLAQYEERLNDPELLRKVVNGQLPEDPTPVEKSAPQVRLELAEKDVEAGRRNVKFRVSVNRTVGPDSPLALRVFHNESLVPIDALKPVSPPNGPTSEFELALKLVHGLNRFYAVAEGEDENTPDGRSPTRFRSFDGPTPGKVHVLAIGIGAYREGSKLNYATRDAESFLSLIKRKAPAREAAYRTIMTDDQVSLQAIDAELIRLRRQGINPEDTVIVYFSGHARIQDDRFQFLLPGADPNLAAPQPSYPVSSLYRRLSAVDSLNRLVIIDSCQTERIGNDPSMLRARQTIRDPDKARIHFILASRNATRTGEAVPLEHGVLTYAILHGLGDPDLPGPDQLRGLRGPAFAPPPPRRADLDGDGIVLSSEVDAYAWNMIPNLLTRMPEIVLRGPKVDALPQEQPRDENGTPEYLPEILQDPGAIEILELP